MVTTVLNSSDLEGILKDAGVVTEAANGVDKDNKAGVKADEKASGNLGAPVEKDDKKVEEIPEDENGLTDEERQGLTERMQKSVGKKHRMMREAEEFAAVQYSERRLAEERAQKLQQEIDRFKASIKPPEQVQQKKQPGRADFKTEEEFLDARVAWGVERALGQQREQSEREVAERAMGEMFAKAKDRINHAIELVDDFQDIVSSTDTIVPTAIGNYMQKSELFAELLYYFGKNHDILLSLGKLEPDVQLVKLGKIESTLQPFDNKSAGLNVEKKTSKDEKPIASSSEKTENKPSNKGREAPVFKPISEGSGAQANKDFADMNIREAIEDYAKRTNVSFTRRKRH